jgi:dienelactone hydrolase
VPSSVHWLDRAAGILTRRRRLFEAGWGDEDFLARVPSIARFAEPARPADIAWGEPTPHGAVTMTDGAFASPFSILPSCAACAFVRRIAPARREADKPRTALVVPPASGDEGFDARAKLWTPLAASEGVEILLLECAMYGLRRPPGQRASGIRTVAEHLIMNLSTIEETRALVEHLARGGTERIGIAGFSMGGSSTALAVAVLDRPVAAAVLAAGRTVVPTFLDGILSGSIELAALGGRARAAPRLRDLFGEADLDRHPAPRRASAVVIVGARRDGYVFEHQVAELAQLWPASELRWLDAGHVTAFVRHGDALRAAAMDSLRRLVP